MKTNKKKYIKSLLGNICLAALLIIVVMFFVALIFGDEPLWNGAFEFMIMCVGWGLYFTKIEME